MILSQSSQYALRIAAFLSLGDSKAAFSSSEVAKSTHIPPDYSSKILRKLVKVGVLASTKGKRGGFKLAKSPSKIRFIEVFEAIEQSTLPDGCVFGLKRCGDKNPCILHSRWKVLKESFRSWASNSTLADVVHDAGRNKRRRK